LCARYSDGSETRGEVEVDALQASGHWVERVWLEPHATIHPETARAVREFDAAILGPGSFYTSLLPIFLVQGAREALAHVKGPVIFVANLLTEGRGMAGFTAADAVHRIEAAIGRRVDVLVCNTGRPEADVLERYAGEHKELLPLGKIPDSCAVVSAPFWSGGEIARHDRRRLAYAVWSVLARQYLGEPLPASLLAR
jgi:uncharacterized cofD-like protein